MEDSKMTEEQLVSLVNQEFDNAVGRPDGEIALMRARAFDYYMSKLFGNEVAGQSQVVSADVAEVIDSYMPSLLRMFTSADNLVTFDAVGLEDEPAAEQETDFVTYTFFKENPAFLILFYWFFDALLQKNGIVKAWWDDSEVITTENYANLTDADLVELNEDEELEVVERKTRKEEQVQDIQTALGSLPQKVTVEVHDIEFKRTCKSGKVSIENVPVEEYRISNDCPSIDPSSARFVGQEREVTRSKLYAMGLWSRKEIDEIPASKDLKSTQPETIARQNSSDEKNSTIGKTADRSQDKILLRDGYIKVDFDNDGYSELRQVMLANNKVMINEKRDRQIFHVICPQPIPHKHFGRSMADKVMDLQLINSTIVRQILDNLYRTNQPGHAVWEQAMGDTTLDDLLTVETGKVARFTRPVGEAYTPMTVPFTAGASFPMLEYFDKSKRDRTGVSPDSQGLSPDQLKNIQTSVLSQSLDISKLKQEAVARIFAETGLKSLFLHIHELLLKHQKKSKLVKLRNEWVEVSPTEWRTRQNMTVSIGLGIGTRDQNLLHLNAIWEKQSTIIQNGGLNLLVTPKNIFNTVSEIVKNANYKIPSMFFTDPGDQLAPPPTKEQEELQKQQQDLIQRQQELDDRELEIRMTQVQSRHENERALMVIEHEKDMHKLLLQNQEREDRMIVAMENIRNKLTELELKYNKDVPGAGV